MSRLLILLCLFSGVTPASNDGWSHLFKNSKILSATKAGFSSYVHPLAFDKNDYMNLYVRSSEEFRVRVYRFGHYGNGQDGAATKVYDAQGFTSRNTEIPCSDKPEYDQYGVVECDWVAPVKLNVSEAGYYFARVTPSDSEHESIATFVVTDDSSTDTLVMLNPTTDQVYNGWTDSYKAGELDTRSMYDVPRASKVSTKRPSLYMPKLIWESLPLIKWLEKNDIDYSLTTDRLVHENPDILNNRSMVVTSGHGEYWTLETKTALEKYVSSGGNLIAAGANTGYWQVRYEGDRIVSYKEGANLYDGTTYYCGTNEYPSVIVNPDDYPSCGEGCVKYCYDPTQEIDKVTNLFRLTGIPEQHLFGVQYQVSPASAGWHTGAAKITGLNLGTSEFFGHEGDVIHPFDHFRNSISSCTRQIGHFDWSAKVDGLAINPSEAGNYVSHIVLHRQSETSGLVVGGLSMRWSWGLDTWVADQDIDDDGRYSGTHYSQQLSDLTKDFFSVGVDLDPGCDNEHDVYFTSSNEVIVREKHDGMRFSKFDIRCDGDCLIEDDDTTADLSNWADERHQIFIADVNADGHEDIIARDGSLFFTALGDGKKFTHHTLALDAWSDGYTVHTGDVNGDGAVDLIAQNNESGVWQTALAKLDASGFVLGDVSSKWGESKLNNIYIGDVNGDDKVDLIAQNKINATWHTALNVGGSFQHHWSSAAWADPATYDNFVADINGDGRVDLIAQDKLNGNWYTALNVNGGQFKHHSTALVGWADSASREHDVYVVDVNSDGMSDLVVQDVSHSGDWYLALGNGNEFIPQINPMLKSYE